MPSKSSPPVRPTTAELDLLQVLWRLGPADAKTVHEALLPDRPDATYATVLRQLQVMHGKGLLNRDESQRPQRYAALHAQDKLQQSLVKDFIAKAFAGSGKALVLAALKSHVSAKERAEIRQLLTKNGDGE
ncbi:MULTISPECIES: BlaI/MecI/CopY family transcriptional regulator [unclassified Roseateles]|uniref:BlaI/MecI/CopY family transcriptional regulator n=1 Tax=unclassified Roseateles TaxID=2626991 RepID=UPI0007007F9E|nr:MULTISPECIES: BlaI/MecI/CopY family transcriptional regulator [unclassified Roseateles]KQW42869.1 BlaI/MecI/CopY family transcriptional regulator [Pelomonas sp. Root405]KRA69547.1 BlaI/MecI/CopY family transcriptional regulator [Pelomonas sp. Root662]